MSDRAATRGGARPRAETLRQRPDAATGARRAVTLRTHALAAVAARTWGEASDDETSEARFLLAHLVASSRGASDWIQSCLSYLSDPEPADLPLLELAEEIGLTKIEVLSVALAAAVEDDVMIGRALSYLQTPIGGSRPTVSLLAEAFAPLGEPGIRPIDILITGAAIRSGLLVLSADQAPLPERSVSVPLHLCLALNGQDGECAGATVGLGDRLDVPLPSSVANQTRRHAAALLADSDRVLVLRTGSEAEGRAVAAAVARAADATPLFLESDAPHGLGPWLLLRRLIPVFRLELGPGERRTLPAIPSYHGPVIALCGPDGSVESVGGAPMSWRIDVPPPDERRDLWERAVGDDELARDLATAHRHGSGRIAHLGRLAGHRCRLNDRDHPTRQDVVEASRSGEGLGLEALAEPLPDAIPDDALVMTPGLRRELEALLLRCRARDGLVHNLGASASARYRPGVRALFVGPSGTGKTLAACWLATRQGLPLYRVDLASVTSKYIGETEKNLAQLLARAEQSEVVLLFDEADSLFGKRTEVNQANDRFANAQTNYLLQRIESYDGIAILTSNSRIRFDPAFSRRLDVVIDFPPPGPEERRALWLSHLGPDVRVSRRQVNRLAASADVNGGTIRNAVLFAALLAHREGRKIEYRDIVRGLANEYRKLGSQMPSQLK